MTEQPEALRLAQELDAYHTRSCHKEGAAELRRLQARLAASEDQAERAVAGCERLRAQRDALLEALKLARSIIGRPDDAHSQMIDAAIKAVEEKI